MREDISSRAESNTVLAIFGQVVVLTLGYFTIISGATAPKVLVIVLGANLIASIYVIIAENTTLAELPWWIAFGSGVCALIPVVVILAFWLGGGDWKDLFDKVYRQDHEL